MRGTLWFLHLLHFLLGKLSGDCGTRKSLLHFSFPSVTADTIIVNIKTRKLMLIQCVWYFSMLSHEHNHVTTIVIEIWTVFHLHKDLFLLPLYTHSLPFLTCANDHLCSFIKLNHFKMLCKLHHTVFDLVRLAFSLSLMPLQSIQVFGICQ